MQSRAAVLREPVDSIADSVPGPVSVETIETADPVRDEVLVEVVAASLCHTDNSVALGHLDLPTPLVMGHEGAGVVRAVGPEVDSVSPGDHVVLGRVACGSCTYCQLGQSNLCETRKETSSEGTTRTGSIAFESDGGPVHHCLGVSSFTNYTVVTEEVAVPITSEIPLDQATLLGCGVFTGVGAVTKTANVGMGSTVVVFGLGGVGLSAVQGADIRSAGEVIAVDIIPEKLRIAESLGATRTIDASKDDPVEMVRDEFGGADYVFDAVGNAKVLEQGLDMLRPRGMVVVIGTAGGGKAEIPVAISELVTSEKRIVGSFNGSANLRQFIPTLAELVAGGRLSLAEMISGTCTLDELNDAMVRLESGTAVRQVVSMEE